MNNRILTKQGSFLIDHDKGKNEVVVTLYKPTVVKGLSFAQAVSYDFYRLILTVDEVPELMVGLRDCLMGMNKDEDK